MISFKSAMTFLYLFFVFLSILVFSFGCTKSVIIKDKNYATYEMKANDVRLQYLNHPLISFEYPSSYRLVDLNGNPTKPGEGGYPMVYGVSDIMFTKRQTNLPEQILLVRIQKPMAFGYSLLGNRGYNNALEQFNSWISIAEQNKYEFSKQTNTLSVLKNKRVTYFGIKEVKNVNNLIYPAHTVSYRAITFDYADLIWTISLECPYIDSEPSEIQIDFNHILNTFKITE